MNKNQPIVKGAQNVHPTQLKRGENASRECALDAIKSQKAPVLRGYLNMHLSNQSPEQTCQKICFCE